MARAGAKSYNSAAPVNYVAGLGRGATGFTTRSDIGPARAAAEATDLSESNFSTEFGYSESLAQGLPYDEDDEAADVVWSEVDAKMDERRRTRREDKLKESLDKFRALRPKLQHQFNDLKRDLAMVSREEWEALPEPGEHRKSRATERRNERYTATPDTLFEKARMEAEVHHNLDQRQMMHGGMESVMPGGMTVLPGGGGFAGGSATPLTDLKAIGAARNSVLSVKLDQMSGAQSYTVQSYSSIVVQSYTSIVV